MKDLKKKGSRSAHGPGMEFFIFAFHIFLLYVSREEGRREERGFGPGGGGSLSSCCHIPELSGALFHGHLDAIKVTSVPHCWRSGHIMFATEVGSPLWYLEIIDVL